MLNEPFETRRKIHTTIELFFVPLAFYCAAFTSRMLGKDLFTWDDFSGVLQLPMMLAIVAYAAVIGTDARLYDYRPRNVRRLTAEMAWACIRGGLLFLGLLFLVDRLHIGRTTYLLQAGYLFAFLMVERLVLEWYLNARRRRGRDRYNTLVLGTGPEARKFVREVLAHPEWGVHVMGFLDQGELPQLWRYRDVPLVGSAGDLSRIILDRRVDCVVFAVAREHIDRISGPLKVCDETGTPAMLLADFFVPRIATTRIAELGGRPVVQYSPVPDRENGFLIKDLFDRLAAAVGLVTVLPIMLMAAVAVKLEDGGPVFFRQERCGLNGRRFQLCKFRSMVKDAEAKKAALLKQNEMSGAAFKLTCDPRITRVGRFLRKTSIDELPQLWNVICGHMSLVGPRPPLPDEVSRYREWQRRKLSMKPGITGLWQVGGRSDVDFEEWMKMDLEYIDHWSLGLDARILARTIPAVLSTRGAR